MSTARKRSCALPAILLPLAIGGFSQHALAQEDFDAYRRQQQQGVQKMQAEFREFKEQQDREFADFLKGRWSEFSTHQGNVRIKEPEPRQAPVFKPAPARPDRPIPAPLAGPSAVTPPPQPPPPSPPVSKAATVAPNTLEIVFYGNAVRFSYDPEWLSYRVPPGDKPQAMSAFWAMMSGSAYEPTLQAINAKRRDLVLDDWGAVTLWRSVVRALQSGRKAEQNLLLWYFLAKSGYDVRMGYSGADVYVFVAIKQHVYSTQYVKVGDQQYYAALEDDHGNSIRTLYTYDAKYPVRLNPLDVQAASTGFAKSPAARRALSFNYKGKDVRLEPTYDPALAQYLSSFPQTDFEIYFNTGASAQLRQGLLPELRKYTARMSEEEAVNFLLAFVQYAFPYKTDIEQFGHEKSFFVEESLYFTYSDCKDRSVFFAWLVRELLGLKVIALHYPGHMTTAVALKQVRPEFTTVEHQGTRFVIADPTYIGASAGEAMPSYANTKPIRVVEIHAN
jgi:hypothetical protein